LADPAITSRVPRAKIEHAFDLKRQLKNIDKIFARVFPARIAVAAQSKPKQSGASARKKSAKRG
ncbi:MAG: hypothetical protein ABSD39_20580, partial [Terriglobales bacterium]